MQRRKRVPRSKSGKSRQIVSTPTVNPADYEIQEPPTWKPPRWLSEFAHNEVWPFLDSHREAGTSALARWLDSQGEHDERLRQLANLDVEKRRLACSPETEDMAQELETRISRRVQGFASAYNAAPFDLPLPPPRNRTLPPDACLAALTAVNDATRDPSQRIGPSDNTLFRILCRQVEELEQSHLPALRAMLRRTVPEPPAQLSGLTLVSGGFTFGDKVHELTGRPRDMLVALLNARYRRCTLSQLREAMNIDDESVSYP